MKVLNLQFRFLIPLVLTLVAAAYLALPLMDQLTLHWFSRDLSSRGVLVTNALADSIAEAMVETEGARLQTVFDRTVEDERLVAIGLCSLDGTLLQRTANYPNDLHCRAANAAASRPDPRLVVAGGAVHVGVYQVNADAKPVATLVLLQDLSFIDLRSQDTRRYLIVFITVLGFIIALITVIVAQLSWRGWVSGVRGILRGEGLLRPLTLISSPEMTPFAADLRARLRDLEDEFRRAQGPQTEWSPTRLRTLLRTQLSGDQIIIVSNREPYIHEFDQDKVIVRRPASGLVSAVEPVMRACSGTWIAHGGGSADREVVDEHDRVGVPPGKNEYVLRRIWLSTEEEQGYYYGFANEGMWPLCHVAHVRPVFRQSDWEYYRAVNQRFADAVVAEARSEDPVVLVQDYHFALLPAMVREQLPRATILTFWHIPWPNPESFGICPWRRELLHGMLGSTILGFHTRFHGKNFIETVDRFLEARIEHEHSIISFQDKETLVESYPISIEWPTDEARAAWPSVAQCRRNVFERLHLR
ncbi:MAG: trehalose-6-phosphate synthase, partial [Burkholderiaceae bacterium]|nr:trehalose-6-phosphate synthase [Burkholderiaceae bacterium]